MVTAQSERQPFLLRSTLSSTGGSFALVNSNSAYLVQQSVTSPKLRTNHIAILDQVVL